MLKADGFNAATFTKTFQKSKTLTWTLTVTDNGGKSGKPPRALRFPRAGRPYQPPVQGWRLCQRLTDDNGPASLLHRRVSVTLANGRRTPALSLSMCHCQESAARS